MQTQIQVQKLNESFSKITGTESDLRKIADRLKVEEPGAYFNPLVQRGFKSPFVYFTKRVNDSLIVYNGHLNLIGQKEELKSDYSLEQIKDYLKNNLDKLPFKPYDYQLKCFIESILNVKHINLCCTGSGKSCIIALLADFFRVHGKRVLLLVPNINLLTQFKADIDSYNLKELSENTEILGAGNKTDFKSSVLISTWQSMIQYKDELNKSIKYDVIINDEVHKNAGEVSSEIATSLLDTKYRFGFTGTLPEDHILLYRLIGLFGEYTKYISSRELIERGLGTPITIKSVIIDYSPEFKTEVRECRTWLERLKFIKENTERNNFICNLGVSLMKRNENSLILFSHTQHGKELFSEIMKKLFPDVNVENKDITGKYSFDFQKNYHIYFINGEDDAKVREKTRLILENDSGAILVSNYSVLSTGVNIKNLHNMIFASPLKAYTTVTQSIGRGIRKHDSKSKFTVFDLVDNLGTRKYSGTFYKQYQHRLKTSYYPEGYTVKESVLKI